MQKQQDKSQKASPKASSALPNASSVNTQTSGTGSLIAQALGSSTRFSSGFASVHRQNQLFHQQAPQHKAPQNKVGSTPSHSAFNLLLQDDRPESKSPNTSHAPSTYVPRTYKSAVYKPAVYKPAVYKPAVYKPAVYEASTYTSSIYNAPSPRTSASDKHAPITCSQETESAKLDLNKEDPALEAKEMASKKKERRSIFGKVKSFGQKLGIVSRSTLKSQEVESTTEQLGNLNLNAKSVDIDDLVRQIASCEVSDISSQHTTADDLDTDHSLTSFNVTINISTEITNCPIDLKKSVEIYVDEWDTVGNLKTYISLVTGIPFERQRLVYPQSKEPEDNRTLASCGIKSDAEIELIVGRLKGGATSDETSFKTVIARDGTLIEPPVGRIKVKTFKMEDGEWVDSRQGYLCIVISTRNIRESQVTVFGDSDEYIQSWALAEMNNVAQYGNTISWISQDGCKQCFTLYDVKVKVASRAFEEISDVRRDLLEPSGFDIFFGPASTSNLKRTRLTNDPILPKMPKLESDDQLLPTNDQSLNLASNQQQMIHEPQAIDTESLECKNVETDVSTEKEHTEDLSHELYGRSDEDVQDPVDINAPMQEPISKDIQIMTTNADLSSSMKVSKNVPQSSSIESSENVPQSSTTTGIVASNLSSQTTSNVAQLPVLNAEVQLQESIATFATIISGYQELQKVGQLLTKVVKGGREALEAHQLAKIIVDLNNGDLGVELERTKLHILELATDEWNLRLQLMSLNELCQHYHTIVKRKFERTETLFELHAIVKQAFKAKWQAFAEEVDVEMAKRATDETRQSPVVPVARSRQQAWTEVIEKLGSAPDFGLANLGSTCFVNSTLQTFLHTPEALKWLLDVEEHVCPGPRACLSCCLLAFVKNPTSRNLEHIVELVELHLRDSQHRRGIEGDAHEVQVGILGALIPTTSASRTHSIENLFRFQMITTVECGNCGRKNKHDEKIVVWPLPLPPNEDSCSVNNLIERCEARTNATRSWTIKNPPPLLNVQLARFDRDLNKLNNKIYANQALTIEVLSESPTNDNTSKVKYRLVNIVNHHGKNMQTGHYTNSSVCHDQAWRQFSDDNPIYEVSPENSKSKESYLLTYVKVNDDDLPPTLDPQCSTANAQESQQQQMDEGDGLYDSIVQKSHASILQDIDSRFSQVSFEVPIEINQHQQQMDEGDKELYGLDSLANDQMAEVQVDPPTQQLQHLDDSNLNTQMDISTDQKEVEAEQPPGSSDLQEVTEGNPFDNLSEEELIVELGKLDWHTEDGNLQTLRRSCQINCKDANLPKQKSALIETLVRNHRQCVIDWLNKYAKPKINKTTSTPNIKLTEPQVQTSKNPRRTTIESSDAAKVLSRRPVRSTRKEVDFKSLLNAYDQHCSDDESTSKPPSSKATKKTTSTPNLSANNEAIPQTSAKSSNPLSSDSKPVRKSKITKNAAKKATSMVNLPTIDQTAPELGEKEVTMAIVEILKSAKSSVGIPSLRSKIFARLETQETTENTNLINRVLRAGLENGALENVTSRGFVGSVVYKWASRPDVTSFVTEPTASSLISRRPSVPKSMKFAPFQQKLPTTSKQLSNDDDSDEFGSSGEEEPDSSNSDDSDGSDSTNFNANVTRLPVENYEQLTQHAESTVVKYDNYVIDLSNHTMHYNGCAKEGANGSLPRLIGHLNRIIQASRKEYTGPQPIIYNSLIEWLKESERNGFRFVIVASGQPDTGAHNFEGLLHRANQIRSPGNSNQMIGKLHGDMWKSKENRLAGQQFVIELAERAINGSSDPFITLNDLLTGNYNVPKLSLQTCKCGKEFEDTTHTRCPSCQATWRTCDCGKEFKSKGSRCSSCRSKWKTCTSCRKEFKSKGSRCSSCQATWRTCDCGKEFEGAHSKCPSCRSKWKTCTSCRKEFKSKGSRCSSCQAKWRNCKCCGKGFKSKGLRCPSCQAKWRNCKCCGKGFKSKGLRCPSCRSSKFRVKCTLEGCNELIWSKSEWIKAGNETCWSHHDHDTSDTSDKHSTEDHENNSSKDSSDDY